MPCPRPDRVGFRRGGGAAEIGSLVGVDDWTLGDSGSSDSGTGRDNDWPAPMTMGGSLARAEGLELWTILGGQCFGVSLGRTEGTSLVSGGLGAW